jgi:hypothetical protein
VWLAVYVNGAATNDSGLSLVGASGQVQSALSTVVFATAGQTLDLRVRIGGTSGLTVEADVNFNYMNIHQI